MSYRTYTVLRGITRPSLNRNNLQVKQAKLNGSVKEHNKFHNYETEKASDAAEYIELFGSFTRDRHARRINVIL